MWVYIPSISDADRTDTLESPSARRGWDLAEELEEDRGFFSGAYPLEFEENGQSSGVRCCGMYMSTSHQCHRIEVFRDA